MHAIAQMQYTLELLPQLQFVYFCPDEKRLKCWRADNDGIEIRTELCHSSPGAGIIHQAVTDFGIDLTKSWLVGEDEQCAAAASVNFMDSETWCDRFRPGMYEVRPVTSEQVKFLESRSFSNDNN